MYRKNRENWVGVVGPKLESEHAKAEPSDEKDEGERKENFAVLAPRALARALRELPPLALG